MSFARAATIYVVIVLLVALAIWAWWLFTMSQLDVQALPGAI